MITSDLGETYHRACKPRFFFKMGIPMLAGMKGVALRLADPPGRTCGASPTARSFAHMSGGTTLLTNRRRRRWRKQGWCNFAK
jgi:hypothetical protein